MRPWYLVGAVVLVLLLVGVASPILAAHVHQSRWGSAAYYPGDPATFYMTLFNDYPGTISVKEILMHWDWQGDGGSYYASAGGQALIPIQTEDYIINFTIPTNVSVGQHLWTIYYLDLNNKKNFVGEGELKIHDPNERTFLSLQAGV